MSRFNVLRSRTLFQRYRGRRVPISCFALLDTFSAVRRASGPVLMFCATEQVSGGTEGVGSCFHRNQGRRVSFSSFAPPDTFSAVRRASGPVIKFCAPGIIFGGTEGVGSNFQILRSRTLFRRYRGRRVPFSCFALRTHFWCYRGRRVSFSAVPRA
jgi:hypothetical protein